MGRPKSGYEVRDTEVRASLRTTDAQKLAEIAENLGFKDRGQMLTAMLERLLSGGFAPLAFAKLGFQFYQLLGRIPPFKSSGYFNPAKPWPPLPEEMPTAPIPAMAEVEELPPSQQKLLQQVQKQTT